MSKTQHKAAIRALPALRASLLWYKRNTVRLIQRSAADARSPKVAAYLYEKAARVRKADLADLRMAYQADRVGEIRQAPRAELAAIVPAIVWLRA